MLVAILIFSYLLILALLIALAYRDIKEYILPDQLNAALALSFVSFHIITYWHIITPQESVLGALTGGGLLLLIRTLADKFYQPGSLGLGDVKLMAAAGLGLGQPNILLALVIGAGIGTLHGLCMGWKNRKTASLGEVNVPAGFGLTIGIGIVMVYQFGCDWLKAT